MNQLASKIGWAVRAGLEAICREILGLNERVHGFEKWERLITPSYNLVKEWGQYVEKK